MKITVEGLTNQLRRANVSPEGYGERIGETREEHVERLCKEAIEATERTYQTFVAWFNKGGL